MIIGNPNNHTYYAAHTVAAKSHDSRINNKQVQQHQQQEKAANTVEKEDLGNIVLPSIGSESSVFSMASSSTTDSDTVATEATATTGASLLLSTGRRSIFSAYWQKNPEQPRSPLIQHYPSRSGSGNNSSSSDSLSVGGGVDESKSSPTSVTSPIDQFDSVPISKINNNNTMLSASPPRRSIFGAASPSLLGNLSSQDENEAGSNNGITNNNNNTDLALNRFFSNHEHMKVLSSSMGAISSGGSTLLLKRRPRSYSCSDALYSVRNNTPANKRTHPLPSCLKRSTSTSKSTTTITTITTSCPTLDPTLEQPLPLSDSTRHFSVTFDSQIEIVAFEPVNSYEGESTCTDGSWTDLFER